MVNIAYLFMFGEVLSVSLDVKVRNKDNSRVKINQTDMNLLFP